MSPRPTVRDSVRFGHRDQVRLAAAWSLLGVCRLVIRLVPFTVVRRLLGEDRTAAPAATSAPLTDRQRWRAHRIGEVVRHAATRTPWTSDCYPQALTARTFLRLRRIPHTVEFGVRRDGDQLLAHAWVRTGDVAVTGGDGSDWTTVGSFAWSPR